MGEAGDQLEARAARIEDQIGSTRVRLEERLRTLEVRARNAWSVRRRVAEHPWGAVAGALATGFVVGMAHRRR